MLEKNSLLSCNLWMSGLLILFFCSKNSSRFGCLLYKTLMENFRNPTSPLSTRALFNQTFDAHDALEDVLPLTKILFSSKLELSNRTSVENSSLADANHVFQDLVYLDSRHRILQSFRSKSYNPERNDGAITKSIAEKIAGSGLAYEDLNNVFSRYGEEGVLPILSRPPSWVFPSCSTSRAIKITTSNTHWSNFSSHHCSFPRC